MCILVLKGEVFQTRSLQKILYCRYTSLINTGIMVVKITFHAGHGNESTISLFTLHGNGCNINITTAMGVFMITYHGHGFALQHAKVYTKAEPPK